MNDESAIFIVSGTAVVLILVLFIIFFIVIYQKKSFKTLLDLEHLKAKAQKEAILASFQGQENERQRIAKDIHDDINGSLTALNLKIDYLGLKIKGNDNLKCVIEEMSDILAHSIESVRSISQNLMPYSLSKFGLSATIENLVKEISCPPHFIASYKLSGEPIPLDNDTCLMLYRSMQEIFNNSIKHSQASQLHVELAWPEDMLRISIADNGVGFDYKFVMSEIHSGLGLKNIESRLSLIGASHEIRSNSDGTKYTVDLNLKHNKTKSS